MCDVRREDLELVVGRVPIQIVLRERRELRGLRNDLTFSSRLVPLYLQDVNLWRTTPYIDIGAWMVLAGTCASAI